MSRKRAWGEDSTVRVELSGGASVSVVFKGNLFDLSPDERILVSDLSMTMQKYKEGRSNGDGKASVQSVQSAR